MIIRCFTKHTLYTKVAFVILEGYFSMISAFAFLVAFAIVFKRLGNTYKYYTATRYLSSYPDIVMYQYHYI